MNLFWETQPLIPNEELDIVKQCFATLKPKDVVETAGSTLGYKHTP